MAMVVASLARLATLRSTPDAVPCSLYSHSLRCCQPQPRESDGDVTLSQGHKAGPQVVFFTSLHHVPSPRKLLQF